MTDMIPNLSDNSVTIFQLDGTDVRGRAIRMGEALNRALGTKPYPNEVATLLGEAMMVAALVARALKFKGRLVIQCHGTNQGAVSLLMADCTTEGNIRGYARWDEEQLKVIKLDSRNPGAETLLGGGTFSMTIDQGPDMDQYQGLAEIKGDSLSNSAEHYFAQSEQIPTQIKLACGQVHLPGEDPAWRGGGMMIQRIAGDATRGQTDDGWTTARALFDTVTDAELIDPDVTQDDLLYRLFHENGVRIMDRAEITATCACSRERLASTLKSFERSALEDMAENGEIVATCEFCNTHYAFPLEDI